MIDIDTVGINRDRSEGQACKLKPLPGPREAWILDPGGLSARAKDTQRQAEPGAESPGDEDPGWRTIDAAGEGKIACDLPPQLELATRVGIEGGALASARTACARMRANNVAGKVSVAGTPILKNADPCVISR